MVRIRKMLSCLLVAALLISAVPMLCVSLPSFSAAHAAEREVIDSGEVNENITWTVYSDGELVLSGEGDMSDYFPNFEEYGVDAEGFPEWFAYRDLIVSIVVEEGITSIGDCAFLGLYNVKNVQLPEGITKIGIYSFLYMMSIKEIELPSSVKSIGDMAFSYCAALRSVNLPDGLEELGYYVFECAFALQEITIPGTVKGFSFVSLEGAFVLKRIVINEGAQFNYQLYESSVSDGETGFDYEMNWPFLEYLSIPSTFTGDITIGITAPFLTEIYNASKSFAVYPVFTGILEESVFEYKRDYIEDYVIELVSLIYASAEGLIVDPELSDFDFSDYLTEFFGFSAELSEAALMADSNGIVFQSRDSCLEFFNLLKDSEEEHYKSYSEILCDAMLMDGRQRYYEETLGISNTVVLCYDDSAQHEILKECDRFSQHVLLDDNKVCSDELTLEGYYTGDDSAYFSFRINVDSRTLILSGNGDMQLVDGCSPWLRCAHLYDTVIFEEGSNITSIASGAFLNLKGIDIYIPSSVKRIEEYAFWGADDISLHIAKGCSFDYYNLVHPETDIKEYIVEEGHEKYYSYDGALYTKEGLTYEVRLDDLNYEEITVPGPMLLQVPSHKTEVDIKEDTNIIGIHSFYYSDIEEIIIPDSVDYIQSGAIAYCNNIKKLDLNSADFVPGRKINMGGFVFAFACPLLDEIKVDEENGHFCVEENGAVLSKDRKILHFYPAVNEEEEFIIPSGVEEIGGAVFFEINECVTSLVLPESLKSLFSNMGEFVALEKLTVLNPVMDFDEYEFDTQVIIYGYPGSTAEAYASENGNEFVLISGCPHFGGEATCESRAICDLCGQEYGELGDHIEDTYTEKESCTVNGYTMTYCSVCYEELDFEVIEAKHLWSEKYTVVTPATCAQKGTEKRICERCQEEDFRDIPESDHDYEDEYTTDTEATCTENGSKSRHCKNCTAVTDVKEITSPGHSFSDWYTVSEATFAQEGKCERKCSICQYTEQKPIPVLEQKEYENKDSGIKLTVNKDAYDGKDVEVDIKEVFDGSHFLALNYGKKAAFDITTLIDGEEVQPGAPVYVQIPVPSDFNKKSVAVFHINTVTGELERIESEIIDGYICFYAASFSVYIIADESTATEEAPAPDCDHLCHKTGFLGFIWKIIQFFSKLFKANPVCSCGAAHY